MRLAHLSVCIGKRLKKRTKTKTGIDVSGASVSAVPIFN